VQYEIYLHAYESLSLVNDFESAFPTICVLKYTQYYPSIHADAFRQSKSCKLHLEYNKNKLSCNFSPLLNYCNAESDCSLSTMKGHYCVLIYNIYWLKRHLLEGPYFPDGTFSHFLRVNASMFSLNRPRLLFVLPVNQINRTRVLLTLPQVLLLIGQTVGTYQMWPASWEVEHWCMLVP
jgi:hypothetical protein